MQAKFKTAATGVFGSGWAWLVVTPDGGIDIVSTPNQDNPMMPVGALRVDWAFGSHQLCTASKVVLLLLKGSCFQAGGGPLAQLPHGSWMNGRRSP